MHALTPIEVRESPRAAFRYGVDIGTMLSRGSMDQAGVERLAQTFEDGAVVAADSLTAAIQDAQYRRQKSFEEGAFWMASKMLRAAGSTYMEVPTGGMVITAAWEYVEGAE